VTCPEPLGTGPKKMASKEEQELGICRLCIWALSDVLGYVEGAGIDIYDIWKKGGLGRRESGNTQLIFCTCTNMHKIKNLKVSVWNISIRDVSTRSHDPLIEAQM
jgi:hypothetical protein